MRISVVIPVRNGADLLPDALASLRDQRRVADEVVIVVDPTSDDDSVVVARAQAVGHGATVLDQSGIGVAGAINQGVGAASGDAIAFLSCDDRFRPGALAAHEAALEQMPAAGYSLGMVSYFVDPVSGPPEGWRPELLEAPRQARMIETTMVRAATFDRVGPHRDAAGASSDVDWFARAHDAGVPVAAFESVVVDKRLHPASTAHTSATGTADLLAVIRDAVQRKRRPT